MLKKTGFAAAAVVLVLLLLLCRAAGGALRERITEEREVSASAYGGDREAVVVLDPGHGGADPGKIGAGGQKEKDINLQIAGIIKEYLEEENVRVEMTRTEDGRLGDTQGEDLKERVRFIDENQPVLAVSIHQNSYPDESVRGPQLFYYTYSDEAEEAASAMQIELENLNPETVREMKPNTTYYLLKHTSSPMVIAECGFLSCPEEAQLLTEEEYQKQLAEALAKGILKYTGSR